MRKVLVASILAVSCAGALPADEPVVDVAGEFSRAVAAHRAGELAEAVERMRRVLDVRPDDADAVWNLGLWTAEAGRPEDALDAWSRYRSLRPDDWRARAKLIQAYQALDRGEDRDRERRDLFALRNAGGVPDLAGTVAYCRDQFVVAGRRVLAFERFDPSGDRPVWVDFVVTDDAGRELHRYVVTSWDAHNGTVWDEAPASREHRTYHLARTGRVGRETVTWYEGRPAYERVRGDVRGDMAARERRHREASGS